MKTLKQKTEIKSEYDKTLLVESLQGQVSNFVYEELAKFESQIELKAEVTLIFIMEEIK